MARPFRQYLPAQVVLTAILLAICLGLLFEGIMIGPEYSRHKPPLTALAAAGILALFFTWLFLRERRGSG